MLDFVRRKMNAKQLLNFSWYVCASVAISCALAHHCDSVTTYQAVNNHLAKVQQSRTAKTLSVYRTFSTDFNEYIDKAINKVMLCYNITGLSLAVIDRRQTTASNNEVIKLTRGYGVKDLKTSARVDENTKFAIGSITKSFTAATFANLSARQNFSLSYDALVLPILQQNFNTTLSNSDSHFNKYGNFRDLLSHRTGILGLLGPILIGSNMTEIEMVQALNTLPALPQELGGGFRESFLYNNWMYALAGALMSNASGGKPWKSLIRETILEPWNINASFLHDVDENGDNFALPIYLFANKSRNGRYEFYYKQYDLKFVQEWLGRHEVLNPAAGIAASAEDMARYIEFWISGGFGTIPPATMSELNNPQTPMSRAIGGIRPPKYDYWDISEYYTAFGLERGIHNNSIKLSHSGGVRSYISQFSAFMAPYPQYGIFVSTNGPGGLLGNNAVNAVEQAVLEALDTDGHPRDWTLDNLCRMQVNLSDLVPHPKPLNTHILLGNASMYTGRYKHPLMGNAEIIVLNSTHLRWTLGTVGSGFLARSTRADPWRFDMDFDGGMDWAQSALEFTAESVNRTVQFVGSTSNETLESVILRFQGGSSANGTMLPDEFQPIFEKV